VANITQTTITANSPLSEGNYSAYIACTDFDATNSTSAITITIDTTPPAITLGNLESNAALGDPQLPMNLTGNVTDDGSGVSEVRFYVNDAFVTNVDDSDFSDGSWWHRWDPNDGTYNITMEACDNAFNCANSTATTNITVNVTKCGDSITSNFTMIEDLDCSDGANGLSLDADGITLDCDSHAMIGDDGGNGYYGVYSNGDYGNLTIRNCRITKFGEGIYLEFSSGHLITNNNISANWESGMMSSIYLWYVANSTVSNNHVFDNDVGIHLQDSDFNIVELNTVESNNLDNSGTCGIGIYVESYDEWSENNTIRENIIKNHIYDSEGYCLGEGIEISSGSAGNSFTDNYLYNNSYGIWTYGDNNILGNNNISLSEFDGIGGNGAGTDWRITERNRIEDSNLTIHGNLTFSGNGVLELIGGSYLTLNNLLLDLAGNVTTLDSKTQSVATNTPADFDFTGENSNITLVLSSNTTTTIAVFSETPTASGTTASLTALKGIDIQVDDATEAALTVAKIKLFYNESELTAAGISESMLKIYYYNTTAADWQLEPNQGVETTYNYVWANVTHFSLFGAFGTTASTAASGSHGSSTKTATLSNFTVLPMTEAAPIDGTAGETAPAAAETKKETLPEIVEKIEEKIVEEVKEPKFAGTLTIILAVVAFGIFAASYFVAKKHFSGRKAA
jgi:PGF-pre-PGF domain-containing protein